MINLAGKPLEVTDATCRTELETAGIEIIELIFPTNGEVKTNIAGFLSGWMFERAWYYWTAKGPGIEIKAAERLHAAFGDEVRVDGHCGAPCPREHFGGLAVNNYHIDSTAGLKALANIIKELTGN